MPLIWNNKEYKLVDDDDEWNKLDFVIVRKIRVEYNQTLSLDILKKSFAIYGAIEKIETFRNNYSNDQFAHVTFKDSRTAYLALIDHKQNPLRSIELIRPVNVLQQPDNPLDLSMSPFYSLPDKCLLVIFGYCDMSSLATLSVVCKKMCQLLRDRVFKHRMKFDLVTVSKMNVEDALVTVSRLVQCIGPKTFHIKMCRSFQSIKWPMVTLDLVGAETNKLSVDVSFLKSDWLCFLDPIAKLVNTICVRRSVYDKYLPYNGSEKLLWPNATLLIMKGFSTKKAVPDFTSIVAAMPNLETILIQRLLFKMELKSLYTKTLKKIYFENCSFKSDISKEQLLGMANNIKAKGTAFPLRLIFDRIQYLRQQHVSYPVQFDGFDDEPENGEETENYDDYNHQFKDPEYISIIQESTYSETMKALNDPTVLKYLYIEVGKLYPHENK